MQLFEWGSMFDAYRYIECMCMYLTLEKSGDKIDIGKILGIKRMVQGPGRKKEGVVMEYGTILGTLPARRNNMGGVRGEGEGGGSRLHPTYLLFGF